MVNRLRPGVNAVRRDRRHRHRRVVDRVRLGAAARLVGRLVLPAQLPHGRRPHPLEHVPGPAADPEPVDTDVHGTQQSTAARARPCGWCTLARTPGVRPTVSASTSGVSRGRRPVRRSSPQPHQASELLVYNELPDNLYNPYVDPFNQLAWQQAIAPNLTHYTAFGPSPIEPPAPYDEAPYAQTQYELNPALTIHLHGGHQTPQNDGHPMDTFGPGQSHMYDYPNDQEATTLWYHDHAMDHTRGHVLNGLAGFYLVEDPTPTRRSACRRAPNARPFRRSLRPPSRRRRTGRLRIPSPSTPTSRRRATTSRSCSSRCRPRCSPGKSSNRTAIAAPTEPANTAVSGGVDGQRHPRAVPDGEPTSRTASGSSTATTRNRCRSGPPPTPTIRRRTRRTPTCSRSVQTEG